MSVKTEQEITAEAVMLMRDRGWYARRNNQGSIQTVIGRIYVGKPGFPDWTFVKTVKRGVVMICHIELKREGHVPSLKNAREKKQLETIAWLNVVRAEPACWANSAGMVKEFLEREFGE